MISQHDVARIITSYVNDNGLISSAKKKRIVCDFSVKKALAKLKSIRLLLEKVLIHSGLG